MSADLIQDGPFSSHQVARASFKKWEIDYRNSSEDSPTPANKKLREIADILHPLLVFLSDAHLREDGNLSDAAWVILYCFAPDLIMGQTIVLYAKTRGVKPPSIQNKIENLQRLIPGLRLDNTAHCGGNNPSEKRFLAWQRQKEKNREKARRCLERKRKLASLDSIESAA